MFFYTGNNNYINSIGRQLAETKMAYKSLKSSENGDSEDKFQDKSCQGDSMKDAVKVVFSLSMDYVVTYVFGKPFFFAFFGAIEY